MDKSVLRVQDIEKSFGRHRVLQGNSFEVPPGTLAGIVGENGAGKSTLFCSLFPNGRFVPGWTRWVMLAFLAVQVPLGAPSNWPFSVIH
jgi:ABC-type branched-subunit amino acid transport system ATPase component